MRRTFLALMGALATLVALVSGRFFVTAPAASAGNAAAGIAGLDAAQAAGDSNGSGDANGSGGNGDAGQGSSGSGQSGPSASAQASGSASASASASARSSGGTNGGNGGNGGNAGNGANKNNGGNGGAKPPAANCKEYTPKEVRIGYDVARYGTVFLTITVCNGVLTKADGIVAQSNYVVGGKDKNEDATATLNELAVKYYKTDLSKIQYSGATATSTTYQKILKTAMNQAGI